MKQVHHAVVRYCDRLSIPAAGPGKSKLGADARVWALIFFVGLISGCNPLLAAELPPFPVDPAVQARASAVKTMSCDSVAAVDDFVLDRGAPSAWRIEGALVSVRRADKDRFAFVLAPRKTEAGDCAVEDVIPLPRDGQLLECSLPNGSVIGLGVHALMERGRRLVLWPYDGKDGLRLQGEDKTAETDTGEIVCALPDTSNTPQALQTAEPTAPRAETGLAAFALALLGMALTYVVFGIPLRSAASLMQAPVGSRRRNLVNTVGMLALRTALASLIFSVLSLPGAIAIGGVGVLACLISRPLWLNVRHVPVDAPKPPSRAAIAIAAVINDSVAAAAGLLCLALLAHHDARLLMLGVALALLASVPSLIVHRRSLLRSPGMLRGTTATLAAVAGLSVFGDPWTTAAVGQALWAQLLGPLVFAAVAGISLSRAPRRPGVTE